MADTCTRITRHVTKLIARALLAAAGAATLASIWLIDWQWLATAGVLFFAAAATASLYTPTRGDHEPPKPPAGLPLGRRPEDYDR